MKHLGEWRLLKEKGLIAVTEAIGCSRRCPRWYNQSFVSRLVPNSEIPSSLIAKALNIYSFLFTATVCSGFHFYCRQGCEWFDEALLHICGHACLLFARCDKQPARQLKRPRQLVEHFSPPCATLQTRPHLFSPPLDLHILPLAY